MFCRSLSCSFWQIPGFDVAGVVEDAGAETGLVKGDKAELDRTMVAPTR